jgi:hypothetical protein
VNFAKHGNPNGPGLTTAPYQRVSDQLLELGPTISVRKAERGVLRFLIGYEAALRMP